MHLPSGACRRNFHCTRDIPISVWQVVDDFFKPVEGHVFSEPKYFSLKHVHLRVWPPHAPVHNPFKASHINPTSNKFLKGKEEVHIPVGKVIICLGDENEFDVTTWVEEKEISQNGNTWHGWRICYLYLLQCIVFLGKLMQIQNKLQVGGISELIVILQCFRGLNLFIL